MNRLSLVHSKPAATHISWPPSLTQQLVNHEYHTLDKNTRELITFQFNTLIRTLPEDALHFLLNPDNPLYSKGMLIREDLHDRIVEAGLIV